MMNAVTVTYVGDVQPPMYKSEFAAGCDLCTNEDVVLKPGKSCLVGTGLCVAIPRGCCGYVTTRSGVALNTGVVVLNSPGVIDSDYRGEVKVLLHNTSEYTVEFERGDRVAQLLIMSVMQAQFVKLALLPGTARNTGGFGSTGV